MANIAELLDKLNDGASTIADIPCNDGEEHRYNSVLKKKEANQFELLFPPNALNNDVLVIGARCHLAIKHKGNTINVVAELDEIVNERRLAFLAKESIRPESLREYFRVSTNKEIRASYTPGAKEVKTRPWKLDGTTIDISGGGVLGLFPAKPATDKRINIEIMLPGEYGLISASAHVIRTYRVRREKIQVAFHFDEIDQKMRDTLIAYCLHEQRRQLRENVEIG